MSRLDITSSILYIDILGDLNWNRRAFSVEKLRSTLSEYPEFKTSLFDYDATIFDLIITIEVSI